MGNYKKAQASPTQKHLYKIILNMHVQQKNPNTLRRNGKNLVNLIRSFLRKPWKPYKIS